MKASPSIIRSVAFAVLLTFNLQLSQAYVSPPGPPPNPPPFLDQSEPSWGSSSYIQGNISMAQTFTPSIGGLLTRLDLCLTRNNDGETNPLLISIDTTQNGVPQTSLGSTTLSSFAGGVWAWVSFDLSSQSISLTSGQTYAIVLSCPGSFNGISSEGTTYDSYSGGESLVQNGVGATWQTYSRELDLTFQTWMTPVPEPSVAALAALGLVLLARLHRQNKASRDDNLPP